MKKEVRLALLCFAATSAPGFAQNALPPCGPNNFDQSRSVFTVVNPTADAVNQQCLLTVYPKGAVPDQARQYPSFYPVEGSYIIELSGGGGGGGGGALNNQGGGGGGAGAAPSRTVQYLSPGVYKLTVGTGGGGGAAEGGQTEAGNPTSLTNANTGQLIAGFPGADVWTQRTRAAGSGGGGVATVGGSSGGSGAPSSGVKSGQVAQPGGASQSAGYSGTAGQSGAQANAGGGGGAGVGSGGAGESASAGAVAGIGNLGGGGGGGRGGEKSADAGGSGGHGFIRLTMSESAPQAITPTPAPVMVTTVVQKYSLSSDTLFGFGKATLKPEGEGKLDDLVIKLRQINIASISYIGHADRIGSANFNQKLSLSRAESVKAYMTGKGVLSEHVTVMGKGETQPITSADACKGRASAAVIACLQPDRRVDIEVTGQAK